MTRLEEIERTYCLSWHAATLINPLRTVSVLYSEFSTNRFAGVGRGILSANENCVEVFEIHKHLYRNGLLTTKNFN